ncbi:MAG: hypothetical protein N838_14180 [Thiohalocapsa sp. PB-PSB1]|jgi:16S rRNA (guanine527-N7)-methyltransferase|nr:MAG: hypothetical protein N838_14180 [Thiohalocapsa sp. PB-PSB1]
MSMPRPGQQQNPSRSRDENTELTTLERDRIALRHRLDQGLAAMSDASDSGPPGLTEDDRERLIDFLLLLARWNRVYNLTAVREPLDMVARHLLDSLSVLPWIRRGPILDVGTGAGLPGIPLALARPDLCFTLLDSNGKKTRFVHQAVLELGLDNIEVVHSRVQAYRPGPKFGTIVARAVSSLSELIGGCAHLAAADAHLLALKGRVPRQEISDLADATGPTAAAIGDLPATPIRLHPLCVPLLDGERHLVEIPFYPKAHG